MPNLGNIQHINCYVVKNTENKKYAYMYESSRKKRDDFKVTEISDFSPDLKLRVEKKSNKKRINKQEGETFS